MHAYKLRFKSALHVDSRGSGSPEGAEEFVRSDTLGAALCLAWKSLYPDTGDDFFLAPPFRVSSAFPYAGDVPFFPAPAWPVWKDPAPEERKELKRVRWLGADLVRKVLLGEPLSLKGVETAGGGAIALSRREKDSLKTLSAAFPWLLSERERVGVDRLGGAAEGLLFFFGLQFFAPGCGLYFLAEVPAEGEKAFESALAFLGDTGLGADRNSGLGHFDFRRADWDLPGASPEGSQTGAYLLSLFNPDPVEDDLEHLVACSAYTLATRSGWIGGSTLGRPPVRVFAEGSFLGGPPWGRVLPLFDDEEQGKLGISHPVLRDFRAFFLPCAVPESLQGESP